MVRQHQQLNGHEFEQTPGDSGGQSSLAGGNPWDHRVRQDQVTKQFFLVQCLVAQLCLTLCDPVDCSRLSCSVHGDSPGKCTGVGCHALRQRIFPTQGSNPGLPHCGQIFYHLSHQESTRILEWAANSFSRGIFPTQKSNQGLLHLKRILTS